MYEMFTGRVPFEADTYMGVLTQHMFVQPVPPSQIIPAGRELGALEDITLECLRKKPEERYQTMIELGAELAGALHRGAGGAVEVAPRSSRNPDRPSAAPRYPMADELEPPTLEEMRVAIDSVLPPRRTAPWALLVAGAFLLAAAAGTWALLGRSSSAPPPEPFPAPGPAAVKPFPAIPPPPSEVPSALLAPPSASVASFPSPSAPPAPPAAKKGPAHPPAAMDDVGDPFAPRH
jgi:serine/threonine-protein kinase